MLVDNVHFTKEDFNVFKIEGFQERMDALIKTIRPKLTVLGDYFAQQLSIMTGEEIFPHVAKHARRTVNPPKDTWVAFASNKRGYKMMPHFQIGLWGTHLFVWFAIIYEAPNKGEFGKKLEEKTAQLIQSIPKHFVWSMDHMKPDAIPHQGLKEEDLVSMFQRLQTVKKSEILCGIHIPQENAVKLTEDELLATIQSTFETLVPLYKL